MLGMNANFMTSQVRFEIERCNTIVTSKATDVRAVKVVSSNVNINIKHFLLVDLLSLALCAKSQPAIITQELS